MAIIVVTWKCGHSERFRARAHSDDYWAHRATHEDCRDCWREQQNHQAAEAAKAQSLPELDGTPKQIAWAETIRQAMLIRTAEIEAKIPATDPHLGIWKTLVERLKRATNASWWIDHRDETPLQIFRRWEAEERETARTKSVTEVLGIPRSSTPAIEPSPEPHFYESPAAARARHLQF